jgi:hypothetical protein
MSDEGAGAEHRSRAFQGADPAALEVACARIARQLSRADVRTVGFLPAGGKPGAPPPDLMPLLDRLASALTGFGRGDVALLPRWTSWGGGDAEAAAQAAAGPPRRIRELRPQVLEILPRPCEGIALAELALRDTIESLAPGIVRVLVDLGGYAPPRKIPTALSFVDAVVPVVAAGHDRLRQVEALLAELPAAKNLGAILVG